jgi:hypothetical protein
LGMWGWRRAWGGVLGGGGVGAPYDRVDKGATAAVGARGAPAKPLAAWP